MSSIYTNFTIQFSDEAKQKAFTNTIKHLQNEELTAATELLDVEFESINFLDGGSIHVDEYSVNGAFVFGQIESGTISFEPESFNDFLLQACIENAAVDYYFDQVGESEYFACHKGKQASVNKVMSEIAKTEPTIGLALAVESGSAKTVEEQLKKGGDANGSYKNVPFIVTAAENSKKKVIKLLLEFGADPNAKDMSHHDDDEYGQQSALHHATYNDNKSLVKLLLDNGANPNIQDLEGNTPIVEPMNYDYNKSIVELLLKHGADINCKNKKGMTPIMSMLENFAGSSADKDDLEYVEWMFEQGIDLNAECINGGNLRWYAGSDNLLSKMLISKGCEKVKAPRNAYDMNEVDNLITAICHGDVKGFESMYGKAENLDTKTLEKCAYYAALCNQVIVLKRLIDDGLDTNISDKEMNPLVVARKLGNHETYEYLIDLHADIVNKEQSDIAAVKSIYETFSSCLAAFTKNEGDVEKALSFMTDNCKSRFNIDESTAINSLEFYGYGHVREYSEITYEHDGKDQILVTRQNNCNGWAKVEFVRSQDNWLVFAVQDN